MTLYRLVSGRDAERPWRTGRRTENNHLPAAMPNSCKEVAEWLGISTFEFSQPVRCGVNDRYFAPWRGGSDAGGARDEKEAQRLADFLHNGSAFGYGMG